ncbi:MAG: DUF5995 family protein, partial [Ilumatobacteraceae bacterium]
MLTDTIEQLRSIALAADDASGHFPAMYARVTERVEIAAASGRFDDGARMERFAEAFAAWYVRARSGHGAVPACWRAAFDVADDSHLMIVQHLLLGINAHVNHDLPQVVVELAPEGDDPTALRADYDAVNDLLAETLPEVLRSLGTVSRWVNLLAARGGERAFDFSLGVARRQAWTTAERLRRLPADARRVDVAELDRLVAVLAYLVANPGRPMSWAVAAGRRLEDHDARAVTRSL